MFRIATWAGVLSVIMAVGLTRIFPARMGPLPAGMRTPIVAFELARTREEVETMFGRSHAPERAAWQRAMDRGNYADFVFLLVYGAFLVSFSRALAASGSRWAELGRRLAPLPAAMDVFENLQLLAITRSLGSDYAEALSRLQLFTWGKWFALAIVCVAWVPALWSRAIAGRTTAVLAVFTLATTAAAFVTRGLAAELMTRGVGLTLISALIVAAQQQSSAARDHFVATIA